MSIVFRDFGTAYLAAPLTVGGVSLTVDNSTWLPSLAAGDYFYLVLQNYSDRSYVEIVKCTATSGNVLTIVRAQSGTAARSFAIGDYAELRLTSDGFSEFVAQGLSAKMDKTGGDFSGLVRFLAPSAARFDLVRSSDDVAAGVALDFNATEGHRTIVGGGTGSNVVTPSLLLRPNGYGNGTGQVKIDSAGLVDGVAFEMRAVQQTKANSLVRYDTLSNYVPGSRAINNHALTSDFSITADEVFSAGATVNANARFQASDFQYRQADGAYGVRFAVSSAVGYLQSGKVDATATEQKLYLTGWMGNPLSLFKVYSDTPLYRRKAGVDYPLYDAFNKPTIDDIVGLADALAGAGGDPVLSVVWMSLRTAVWEGYAPSDGQLLSRALYPDAWDAIRTGKVPVCTDQEWLADPSKRGCCTHGDGVSTFRVPDFNGVFLGSYGPVYLGGGVGGGTILRDRIQNITAGGLGSNARATLASDIPALSGAFTKTKLANGIVPGDSTGSYERYSIGFDAGLSARTGDTTRPITAEGCFGVRLYASAKNQGSLDVSALTAEVEELKKGAAPVCTVEWAVSRRAVRSGFTAGDGQLLSRAMYPSVWEAIESGRVPVCSDSEWLSTPSKRGCYTAGDGSTTFRVPDYNGMSEGSLGAAFLRGDGLNSGGAEGRIQGDAIRNITGSWTEFFGGLPSDPALYSGAIALVSSGAGLAGNNASVTKGIRAKFDASLVVPTAADNHPVNATGCWTIKLFGAVQEEGVANLFELASSISSLLSRMDAAEAKIAERKSTCLVHATGTGAHHETVVTQLPTNIAVNTRYVLPNPFGNNTPVICWAELLLNGVWAETGFAYSAAGGFGTKATYVQGVGVVVQTGSSRLNTTSANTGGGHGISTEAASAPCRVFVRKLEA